MTYENILILLSILHNAGVITDVPRAVVTDTGAVPTVLAATTERVIANATTTAPHSTIPTAPSATGQPSIFTVPYFSQLRDITSPTWSKRGCGIASLAMLIEYYNDTRVDINKLLDQGIASGAYIADKGWSYAGLISLGRKYELGGISHDLKDSTLESAFSQFTSALKKGPVMASVHYTFDPKNSIPHLVIVTGVKDNRLYYNDPALGKAGDSIPVSQFKSSWKKRYLEFWHIS